MKKKSLALLLVVIMTAGLAGCSSAADETAGAQAETEKTENAETETEEIAQGGGELVIYSPNSEIGRAHV